MQNGLELPKGNQTSDRTALLIIDILNCFAFEGAEAWKPGALAAANRPFVSNENSSAGKEFFMAMEPAP